MDDRGEVRGVVGRDILRDPSGLLGLVVSVGVGPTDVPEYRGSVPLGSEGAEVLAGRERRGKLLDVVVIEIRTEGFGDPASRSIIIVRRSAGQGTTEIRAFGVRAPRGPEAG